MKCLFAVISFFFLSFPVLKAQNDPLKGQDSLLLELERTEVLPASSRNVPVMETIKPEPEPLYFTYTKDSIRFTPPMPTYSIKEENIKKPTWEKLNPFYLRLGMGIWLNPIAQISLAQTRDVGIDWSVFASHQSNHKNWVGLSATRDEQIQIKAALLKPNFQLYTRINFRNQGYFWYADSSLERTEKPMDSLKMSYTCFSFLAGIKKQKKQGFSYDIPIEIRNYSDKLKVKEFNFHIAPKAEYFSKIENVGYVGVGVHTNFWTASGINDSLFPNRTWFWADVLGKIKNDRLIVEAGVRLNYTKPDSQSFKVYPVLNANYLINNKLSIQANVSGLSSQLSWYDLRQENRFLGRNFYLETVREKMNTRLGIHALINPFSISFSGGYKIWSNLPVYYANYQSDTVQNLISDAQKHKIIYDSKTSQKYFLASLVFKKKSYIIGLDGFYSINRLQNLTEWFHYPQWKVKIFTQIQHKEKFYLSVNFHTLAARPFTIQNNKTLKSPVMLDLQLIAEYRISPKVSVWLEGNNLLNQKYQKWYLYQEMPLNVSLGVGLKL